MTNDALMTPLEIPARRVAPPASISPAGRTLLAAAAAAATPEPYPDPEDGNGWRALIARRAQRPVSRTLDDRVDCARTALGGAAAYRIEPRPPVRSSNVVLDFHGGAFVFGGGEQCREKGIVAAVAYGAATYALDYRMPPDSPYPAALDDCFNAYVALLERFAPGRILVQGTSAGGNLAAALMLRLHDAGVALPAGLVLRTPEVDLTESGDSFRTNLGLDTTLTQSLMPANRLYAAGRDLMHPLLSPLFGSFGRWHPPTTLTTGTRDLLLSNTVRMHRRLRQAGVAADLIVEEAAPHGGLPNTPESDETWRELRLAAERYWSAAAR